MLVYGMEFMDGKEHSSRSHEMADVTKCYYVLIRAQREFKYVNTVPGL